MSSKKNEAKKERRADTIPSGMTHRALLQNSQTAKPQAPDFTKRRPGSLSRSILALILSAICYLPSAHATITVTGLVSQITSEALETKIMFTPAADILLLTNGLSAGPAKTISSAANGGFTNTFNPGTYLVRLPLIIGRNAFTIAVPHGNGIENITNLIAAPWTYEQFTNTMSSTSGALTNQEIRNVTFLGTVASSGFQGDGNALTELDASHLLYGALPIGRIQDGSITSNKLDATAYVAFKNDVTQSGLAAGSYAINGLLVDGDAGLYLSAVGKTNSQFAARADGGFKALKEFNLWTNLIDGAVLGTNLNLSGSFWRTFKLNYGTNVNSPTVLDYGLQFDGTSRAYVRNLSDMRTNTILVCYQSIGNFHVTATNAIFAAQNSSSSNGSVATFVYPYVGSPIYLAPPLNHFVGENIASGQATSNTFTAFTGTSVSGRHMDEHYISIGVSNLSRTATIDGYGATLTNTTFALSSAMTSFNLAAFLAGDSGAATTNLFKGNIKSFLIFNRMLTTNEVRQAMRALRWFDVRENNYVFVGDSLTQAYDDPHDTTTYATNNWPYLFMNNPANSNRYFYRNWGKGGQSMSTFSTDLYTNQVQVFAPGGPVKQSVLMYRLGANDILQYADVNNSLTVGRAIWSLADRDGFKVELLNLTPMTNQFGFTNDYNRVEFNRALETNASYYSKLWPVADLFPYINTNSFYSIDGVHPMYAANRAIADWLTSGGSSITSTGALQRFSGTIKADAFWGDGTRLDFSEDVAFMRDDFFSGISTAANGDLNWATTGTVTTRNTVYDTSRWGVLSLESAATSGTAGQIYLSAAGGGYLGTMPLATVAPWRAKFIIRPTNTNAVANVAGFAVPSSVWGATTHGIYVRADDTMDGGNWKFITRGAGGATTNDTGVVARTNSFVKFEFQSLTVGSVMLRVDGGSWITNSTTMPASVSPIFSIVPRENVAKTNAIDFFEFVAWPDR